MYICIFTQPPSTLMRPSPQPQAASPEAPPGAKSAGAPPPVPNSAAGGVPSPHQLGSQRSITQENHVF